MKRKYELVLDDTIKIDDRILYRIKALKDFGDVEKGHLGGYIEKEDNLSHEGNCWVYYGAKAYQNAKVLDDAEVYGLAKIYGNAIIKDSATIYGHTKIHGDTIVSDYVDIYGYVEIYGDAKITGDVIIKSNNKTHHSTPPLDKNQTFF